MLNGILKAILFVILIVILLPFAACNVLMILNPSA